MIQQKPRESIEPRESYEAHDLIWLRGHIGELGSVYGRLVESISGADLERPLTIPWFDFR
jgi:hypothetical protein